MDSHKVVEQPDTPARPPAAVDLGVAGTHCGSRHIEMRLDAICEQADRMAGMAPA
jgi:hypothetical protein